jgi:hypothetical protein
MKIPEYWIPKKKMTVKQMQKILSKKIILSDECVEKYPKL